MSKEEKAKKSKEHSPGLGPAAISDQSKTATNTISASNRLPAGEKELAQESARFADLCQYFERQRMDVPVEILDQLGRASRLAIPERIEAMKKLNQRLMEYLNDAGQDHCDSAVTGGPVSVAIFRTVTDLPGAQRTSIRLACDRGSKVRRYWIVPGLLRFNGVGDFNPQFPDRAIGATFECADLTFAFGGNRLLFVRKIRNCPPPDYYLLALSSERCGAFDCRNSGWKSETVVPIAVSQFRDRGEALLLMRPGDWVRTSLGIWQLRVADSTTPRGAHPNGRMRFEKFVMRYAKNSLVINRERDIPLLLQVRNSRFISHEQLFESHAIPAAGDHSRSSFNWRTRRLVGSGYLCVCECRSGAGSPCIASPKKAWLCLSTVANLRPYCIPGHAASSTRFPDLSCPRTQWHSTSD